MTMEKELNKLQQAMDILASVNCNELHDDEDPAQHIIDNCINRLASLKAVNLAVEE